MTKINNATRKIIRDAAKAKGCKYRITAEGEVHFYGEMPNSTITGWYLVSQTVNEAIIWIKR